MLGVALNAWLARVLACGAKSEGHVLTLGGRLLRFGVGLEREAHSSLYSLLLCFLFLLVASDALLLPLIVDSSMGPRRGRREGFAQRLGRRKA